MVVRGDVSGVMMVVIGRLDQLRRWAVHVSVLEARGGVRNGREEIGEALRGRNGRHGQGADSRHEAEFALVHWDASPDDLRSGEANATRECSIHRHAVGSPGFCAAWSGPGGGSTWHPLLWGA
jgi:hypothetical protein